MVTNNVPFINTQSVMQNGKKEDFIKGLYFEGNNQNYSNFTSNGLGGSEIPIRFKAKQHILLLRIKSNKSICYKKRLAKISKSYYILKS